jgi:hypothetical protein
MMLLLFDSADKGLGQCLFAFLADQFDRSAKKKTLPFVQKQDAIDQTIHILQDMGAEEDGSYRPLLIGRSGQ